jgi:hypothetical protein
MAGRKLKVFQAQFGFYDTVVAAPSRAAALKAWGTRQNLFASGDAKVVTDEAAVAAATAHPETPLQRAVGSSDPFKLKPTGLPKIPDAPRPQAGKPVLKRASSAPAKPPADRSKLNAAEKTLHDLDERRKREDTDLQRRQDDLDAQRAASQSAYVNARKAATAEIVAARTAYRKAGGED